MPLKMKELPRLERPYEKFKIYGPEKLSNAELLAIIIKNGTKDENSISIANKILLRVTCLKEIQELSLQDLKEIKGIGDVKAIQIKAICELTKRMNNKNNNVEFKVTKPEDIAKVLIDEYKFEKQEKVKVVILNTKNIVLRIIDIVSGEENVAYVTPKQILAEAIRMQAPKIILVHNHPSGDTMPSKTDYRLTRTIIEASKIMGIKLLDHIIISGQNYESIFSREDFQNEVMGL